MKDRLVITIARSFGSGGRAIGEKLAEELGIPFYDRNLIRMAAEKSGIDESLLASADEKIIDRLIDPYALTGGLADSTNEQLYRLESQIIRDLAEKESCVIVGRLADWVLRENKNAFHVYIAAPYEDRIRRVMEQNNLDESKARKMVKRMDKIRKGYYAYFTDWDWNGLEGRDVIINSSLRGIDGTVEILKQIVEKL